MQYQYKLDNFSGHIKSLDGLRGLAIISVLLYHIFPYVRIFQIGWIGVDLFFVISGFLITGILLDTLDHRYYWRNFIARRVLRIFPLYYLTILILILACTLSPTLANSEYVDYGYFVENKFWYFSYLMNWRITDEGSWLPTIILNIFWSLCIEEQFYFFWPLLIYLFKKQINVFIITTLFGVTLIRAYLVVGEVWTETAIYTNTLTRIDTILVGALLAVAIRNRSWRIFLERNAFYILIFLLSLLLLFLLFIRGLHPFNYYTMIFGYPIIYMLFGIIMLSVIQRGNTLSLLRKMCENKVLVFFGKYSYAMYVYHWIIYKLLYDTFLDFVSQLPESLAHFVSSLVVLALVIAVSQVSWFAFEYHFLKLKRYFKY